MTPHPKKHRRKATASLCILLLLTVLLCACEPSRILDVAEKLTSRETSRSPEGYWSNHLFVSSRNGGICKNLVGQVELFFVFVNDPESQWTAEEKAQATEFLTAEVNDLEKEAEKFDTELEIEPQYHTLQLKAAADHYYTLPWLTQYANEQGYDSLAELQEQQDSLFQETSSPVVFLFDYPGRSYAMSGTFPGDEEYAVLFELDAFRHELFHLYGAEDYYFHPDTESSAALYLPWSIMNDGSATDDLTAYCIGWLDTLTPQAVKFLEATASLTYSDLENARVEDQITGVGTIEYDGGGVYTGELEFGVPQGKGKYTFPDGSTYEGDFEDGYFHGYGVWTDVELGYRYEGEFVYDLFQGKGFLTFDDGETYEGEFQSGEYHGQGSLVYPSGDSYVGEFKEGNYHGQGTFTYADGSTYVGQFKNGRFHGQGTYTDADGSVYVGQFKSNLFHGQGTMTYPDGTVESGTWFEDEFVG